MARAERQRGEEYRCLRKGLARHRADLGDGRGDRERAVVRSGRKIEAADAPAGCRRRLGHCAGLVFTAPPPGLIIGSVMRQARPTAPNSRIVQ